MSNDQHVENVWETSPILAVLPISGTRSRIDEYRLAQTFESTLVEAIASENPMSPPLGAGTVEYGWVTWPEITAAGGPR
jgi:hypothetical protein